MTINSDDTLNSFGVIPVIAVSACLMGDKVRFDRGHKLHKFVSDKINPYFKFVKILPPMKSNISSFKNVITLLSI